MDVWGEEELGGGGFFVALLGFDAMASDDKSGNAGRFAWTTAPHIVH